MLAGMSSSLNESVPEIVDVAIVGAGITGLSAAWHLTERGLRVAAFDGTGIGSGATAVQPGGVRQQWGTEVACRMALEAYAFYSDIGDRLTPAVDPKLTACGYLFVARGEEELAAQRQRLALQHRLGIPSREVTPAEAGELVLGPIRESVGRYAIPSAARQLSVLPGALGGRAEVLGALALALSEMGDSTLLDGTLHAAAPAFT